MLTFRTNIYKPFEEEFPLDRDGCPTDKEGIKAFFKAWFPKVAKAYKDKGDNLPINVSNEIRMVCLQ